MKDKIITIRIDEDSYKELKYISGGNISGFIRKILSNLDYFEREEIIRKLEAIEKKIIELETERTKMLKEKQELEHKLRIAELQDDKKLEAKEKLLEQFVRYISGAHNPKECQMKNWLESRNDLLAVIGFDVDEALEWCLENAKKMRR